ncbi:MAG: MBL fold metallo-hydrolase [Ferrovum sp.]|nr:MBL fold metallo-hydrolase [Ferrovum sp.]
MAPPHSGFFQWVITHWWSELSPPVTYPPQTVTPDLKKLHTPAHTPQLTWVGHSTVLLQMDGLNLLFDPIFSEYASPFPPLGPKRYQPPGVALKDLPHIDVVMISHNHYDHMDLPSLRALAHQKGGPPWFLVPLGDRHWFLENIGEHSLRTRVRELNWDQHATLMGNSGPVECHFDAVQHWSTRTLFDKDRTLWGSWAILSPDFRFWFSGDLGYSNDTTDIGRKYGHFDLAAIAIGSYQPHWYMKPYHISPVESVKVLEEVHAQQAIGIHWGTFPLSDEGPDQAPQDLDIALMSAHIPFSRFFVLRPGQTYFWSASTTHPPLNPPAP